MNRNTRLSLLLAAVSTAALAGDLFWSATAPQPASWNDLSSWKTGGPSQWDPDATALPSQETQDTVYFRDVDATVTAAPDSINPFWILKAQNNASVTFAPPASARFEGIFAELGSSCPFAFLSGTLSMPDREFYVNRPGDVTFSGPYTRLIGRDPLTGSSNHYLQFQLFAFGNTIRFLNGVQASDIRVNLSPFDNNGYDNTLLIAGAGTTFNNLLIGGRYYNSTIRIEDGATIDRLHFKFEQNIQPEVPLTSNLFYTANTTIHDLTFEWEFAQPPNAATIFGPNSHISIPTWDGHSLQSPNALLRLAGPNTTVSNFTYRISAPNATLQITDAATPISRWFRMGYGASNQSATISGPDTLWTLAPNDMELEAVLTVGEYDNGSHALHNTLLIENGATLNIVTNIAFKNGNPTTRLTGLLIGKEPGDNYNTAIIRNGATVNNAFWTGVGGTFLASGADGGAFNTLSISNATYHGGTSYNDVWDATLFVGGMNGYSNTVEILDGATATFNGCAQLARAPQSGGNTLRVRNASLSVASRICLNPQTLAYGSSLLDIQGTNATVTASALDRENYSGSDPLLLHLTIPATGRSIPTPYLTLTSHPNDFSNPLSNGGIQLSLDIHRVWAHSGRDHSIPLLSLANNPGNPGMCEYSLNQLAATIPSASLTPCTTSVSYNPASDSWILSLTAGSSLGTTLLIR